MRRAIGFLTVGILVLFVGLPSLAQDIPESKAAKDDVAFLTFGKVIEAVTQNRVDWKNPHQVTAHAVRMACQGKTKELIKEMGHVQDDAELGKALLRFIENFGPDLERYL